jgi:hypothetical protein
LNMEKLPQHHHKFSQHITRTLLQIINNDNDRLVIVLGVTIP